jgi:hypothetical protein
MMADKLAARELFFKLGKRERLLVYPVVALAVLFMINYFFVIPMRRKLDAVDVVIRKQETELSRALGIGQRKDQILRDYAAYKKYVQPPQDSSAPEIATRFLKEIERIAKESGVSILSLSPEESLISSGDKRVHSAELNAEGDAWKFYDFLDKLQSSSLLMKLEEFSLTAKDGESGFLRMNMKISLAVV